MIAALNTTAAPDRAVVTSARNFFRTMGGAFGLASKSYINRFRTAPDETVSNAIYNNSVKTKLAAISFLSEDQQIALTKTALEALELYSGTEMAVIQEAFAGGLKMVWIFFVAVSISYFLISFGIKVSHQ